MTIKSETVRINSIHTILVNDDVVMLMLNEA